MATLEWQARMQLKAAQRAFFWLESSANVKYSQELRQWGLQREKEQTFASKKQKNIFFFLKTRKEKFRKLRPSCGRPVVPQIIVCPSRTWKILVRNKNESFRWRIQLNLLFIAQQTFSLVPKNKNNLRIKSASCVCHVSRVIFILVD